MASQKDVDRASVKSIVMLPCPFCGGEEFETVYCDEDCCGAKPRWIQCPCGAELGGIWNSDDDANRAWNTRLVAESDGLIEKIAHEIENRLPGEAHVTARAILRMIQQAT